MFVMDERGGSRLKKKREGGLFVDVGFWALCFVLKVCMTNEGGVSGGCFCSLLLWLELELR